MSTEKASKRPLWREPLVMFVLIGVALYAIDVWRSAGDEVAPLATTAVTETEMEPRTIVISEARVAAWRREIRGKTGAPATDAELRAVVARHVREEAMFREALRRGLHRSDHAVRARMVEKMQFVLKDLAVPEEPTEEELRTLFDAQGDYGTPARFSFEHAYFDRGQRKAEAEVDARAALAKFGEGRVGGVGDGFARGKRFRNRTEVEITRVFGAAFAAEVARAGVGAWVGPVESPYGFHLVRVNAVTPSVLAGFDEVRDQVRRDLLQERRDAVAEASIEAMLLGYDVVYEGGSGGLGGEGDP